MLFIIYISLAIIFFLVALVLVYSRMIYLNTHPESYNSSYNGHERFLEIFRRVVRFYLKKLFSFLKVFYQNILHVWVQFIAKMNSLSEKIYMKSRNKFVDEVVKDKKSVPHFWSHLKKYKREIDEEKEEQELAEDSTEN
ncbi:hypothetical protein SDC9_33248 [bioreactor metagenome]|uniref:Uncharacterized protein n=1 Tax=bioreactor metagenome TaxID=1076179 RepID=A0A644V7D8_9ZZZZ|nr:hypothetical protein [Candidatus Elulimicrobiales bacterium]